MLPVTAKAFAPLVEPGPQLSPGELRRYSRHLLLPELGVLGQRRLKNARVVCIGAGGLGSPVIAYLAAAGVGTLGIVDDDRVEESNLQRQIIHGQSGIGRSKVASARAAVAQINPLVEVVEHEVRLSAANALEILGGYDLIVDGSDNFATRYLVNDAAVLLGRPCVWGSVLRFDGQASVFWAEHGPCYRCLHPKPPPSGSALSCAEGGVLGAVCAAIGAVQATEALKLLTGIGTPLVGRVLMHDALNLAYRTLTVRKNPDCALCGVAASVTALIDYDTFCGVPGSAAPDRGEITPQELRAMMDGGERILLIDVREPAEHAVVAIPGSVLIPRGDFIDGSAWGRLPADVRIVLHCQSGARSAEVLKLVRSAGFVDAVHLSGGVHRWLETSI